MVTAFVFAQAKTGKERDVLKNVMKLPEVREAHAVYGDYDLVIKAEADNVDALNSFLLTKIRKIPDVAMTTTMIGL